MVVECKGGFESQLPALQKSRISGVWPAGFIPGAANPCGPVGYFVVAGKTRGIFEASGDGTFVVMGRLL